MRELSVAEQRYQAVMAVIGDGLSISQVAEKVGVSRQTLHAWLARYEAEGLEGLVDRSHRPVSCPHQMPAAVEAMLLELRRSRPYWSPRRLVFELAKRRVVPVPSESAAYRDGRERLNALLSEQRSGIDHDALAASYDDFRAVNLDFKAPVADWQLKDGQPNAHDDADYDGAVLARPDEVHERVVPIIAAAAEQLPRLTSSEAERPVPSVAAGRCQSVAGIDSV